MKISQSGVSDFCGNVQDTTFVISPFTDMFLVLSYYPCFNLFKKKLCCPQGRPDQNNTRREMARNHRARAISYIGTKNWTMTTAPPHSTDKLTACIHAVQMSMLSIGSGNGSQQEAIVKRGLPKVQVTFYDSKAQLLKKYPHAAATLTYLQQNCEEPPRYQVDATTLDKLYPAKLFDLIFFIFPHTGIPNASSHCVESKIIKPDGEIQITLKNGQHYERWQLPELLEKDAGLSLEASQHPLDKSMFPGYKH
jgi:hypothetical protein